MDCFSILADGVLQSSLACRTTACIIIIICRSLILISTVLCTWSEKRGFNYAPLRASLAGQCGGAQSSPALGGKGAGSAGRRARRLDPTSSAHCSKGWCDGPDCKSGVTVLIVNLAAVRGRWLAPSRACSQSNHHLLFLRCIFPN